ncbi:hypothetical protein [Nocardia sp. Marseille-Q1738]
MNRITRLTVGVLLTGAVLSPAATAQAEISPQPTPSVSLVAAGDSGSSTGSAEALNQVVCTILKLVLLNQGPQNCQ